MRYCLLALLLACGRAGSGDHPDATHGGGDDDAAMTDATTDGAHADAAMPDAGNPCLVADPFTIAAGAQPITFAQLVAHFGPGQTSANVGPYMLRMRSRASCNSVTGCTPWTDPGSVTLMESNGTQRVPATSGGATLQLDAGASPPKIGIQFAGGVRFTCSGVPQTGSASWSCGTYATGLLWFYAYYLGSPRLDNTTLIEWKGIITSDGWYQFATQLASDLGTAIDGTNNLEQVAIYGSL